MNAIYLILHNGITTSVAKCIAWRTGKTNIFSYVKELMWKRLYQVRKSNLYKNHWQNRKEHVPDLKNVFFPSKSSSILSNNLPECVVHQQTQWLHQRVTLILIILSLGGDYITVSACCFAPLRFQAVSLPGSQVTYLSSSDPQCL